MWAKAMLTEPAPIWPFPNIQSMWEKRGKKTEVEAKMRQDSMKGSSCVRRTVGAVCKTVGYSKKLVGISRGARGGTSLLREARTNNSFKKKKHQVEKGKLRKKGIEKRQARCYGLHLQGEGKKRVDTSAVGIEEKIQGPVVLPNSLITGPDTEYIPTSCRANGENHQKQDKRYLDPEGENRSRVTWDLETGKYPDGPEKKGQKKTARGESGVERAGGGG